MSRLTRRNWTAQQDEYLGNNFKAVSTLKLSEYLGIPQSTIKDRLRKLGCLLTEQQKRWHYLDGITVYNEKVKSLKQPRVNRMFPGSTIYAITGIYEARKKDQLRNGMSPEDVLEEIAYLNKVSVKDICGFKRNGFLIFCRQAFCRVAERILNLNDEQTGALINRDRTTALYHRNRAADLIATKDRPFIGKWTRYLEQTKYLKIKNNG